MFLFKVLGLKGPNCIRHMTGAIKGQDAKARIEIKLEEGLVYVETAVDLEKIRRAVEGEGYRIISIEARP